MRVASNSSPVCYLILIEEILLLPELFSEIVIPPAVQRELAHPDAPPEVQDWIADPPAWLRIAAAPAPQDDPQLYRLDPGEREAILLAEELKTDLLLLDDRDGRKVARDRGLPITGLIGVLDLAIKKDLADPHATVKRLRSTNFRVSEDLLDLLLR